MTATAAYREATHADGLPHLADDLERALDAAPRSTVLRSNAPRELLVVPTVPRLLRFAAVEWAWMIAAWIALALLPPWASPLPILVVAGRLHALGVILHDATHMPLRGKSAPLRLLEIACGYPLATTLDAMRYHHLRHHRDNGMATDPYLKPVLDGRPLLYAVYCLRGVLLLPVWMSRGPLGLLAVVVPRLRNPYGRWFLQDRSGEELAGSREVRTCAAEELGLVLFDVVLIAAFVAWPRALLLGYLAPAMITGVFAARRVLREHRYERAHDRRAETLFATTNDHGLGRLGAFLLAPRNIGYHVVHHVHPQVALQALPALRLWYRTTYATYPPPR